MLVERTDPFDRLAFLAARAGAPREDAIALSGAPVLITGETGTGKEATARRLHLLSERKGRFIAVNCGALSDGLIEAELFGHEAGAFTGAARARPGWFEAANGGTLLLDEIGDLPAESQSKLLRVLQESQVTRLGSRNPITLDVRLLAATNVDLEEAVRSGRFRSDLYYRLNVARIHLPPLRERSTDILPLARLFIARQAAETGAGEVQLSQEAAARLQAHGWPGNIRELQNAIELACVLCRNREITANDLCLAADPDGPLASPPRPGAAASSRVDDRQADSAERATRSLEAAIGTLLDARAPDILRTVEQLATRIAYDRCGGNQARAARLLGITRNTMRTLLRRGRAFADARASLRRVGGGVSVPTPLARRAAEKLERLQPCS